jgi:putative chitinase
MAKLTNLITTVTLLAIGGVNTAAARLHVDMIDDNLPGLMEQFSINTPLRISHFLAQVAHESDSFNALEEYASGRAYEGRQDLGNIKPGDGVRFKGRGLIMVTGRTNYRNFTAWMRSFNPNAPDFEANPELLDDREWASWSAIWFWAIKHLNVLADRDDLRGVTKVVNGGYNGYADRAAKLLRAKAIFAKAAGAAIAAQQGAPVLHRGDRSFAVGNLQEQLKKAGFYHLAIDEDFGGGTEGAVIAFQKSRGLIADGIVGKQTAAALQDFLDEVAA